MSSCVNARGIPTAAYQVLHLFPEVGYPPAGVPPSRQGVPPSQVWWGVPEVGYPLAGVPPSRGYLPPSRGSTPPTRSNGLDLAGVPPWLDLAGVPAPTRCVQTDWCMNRHVWKHYLPVVLRTRSVTKDFILFHTWIQSGNQMMID